MELQKKKIFVAISIFTEMRFLSSHKSWMAGEFFFGIENNKTKVKFLMILIKKRVFYSRIKLLFNKKNENSSKLLK